MRKNSATHQAIDNLSFLPQLVNLGLSLQEAKVYLILLAEGPLSAREIAIKINVFPHSVYRVAKKLEQKKLIAVLKISPLTFQALSPQLALTAFVKEKAVILQKEAAEISQLLNKKKIIPHPTKIDLIFGKFQIFMLGAKLVNQSKKEIVIVSIGESIPQELLLAMNKAHQRGVVIRLIAHKYDQENQEILENFKKNGYEIRHFPDDWGFHLAIYDGQKSLLIINNPKDPQERVAVQIFSLGLSKALRDYFYSIWEKANQV